MRPRRTFRPGTDLALEGRFLLSRQAYPPRLLAQAHGVDVTKPKPVQLYPIAEVNAQYDAFARDLFNVLLPSYVQALINSGTSSGTTPITVLASLAQPHAAGSSTLQLQPGQGNQFGGTTFNPPILVLASPQGLPAVTYLVTGRNADTLTGVTPYLGADNDLPAGTPIQARLGGSTQANAAAVFQAALFQRAQQMANTLVGYFNSLPIPLPAFQGIPRQPGPRNLLQKYVYNSILANNQTSLLASLLSIPLPTDTDGALTLYKNAAQSAIEASRTNTIDGIQQIWAGAKIPPHYNYP